MIFFGANSTKIAVEPIEDKCTNCHTAGTMDVHIFQRYAHIFMIPLFPAGKYSVSQCNHCRKVLRERAMPAELKLSCDKIKAHTRAPIWTWAGLIVLLLCVMISVY